MRRLKEGGEASEKKERWNLCSEDESRPGRGEGRPRGAVCSIWGCCTFRGLRERASPAEGRRGARNKEAMGNSHRGLPNRTESG